MLFPEIRFEFDGSEPTSNPVLRSSLSVPFIDTHQPTWPPNSARSLGRQSYQSSVEDLSLINKFVSNFRISFHHSNILKQLKQRYSTSNYNNNQVD